MTKFTFKGICFPLQLCTLLAVLHTIMLPINVMAMLGMEENLHFGLLEPPVDFGIIPGEETSTLTSVPPVVVAAPQGVASAPQGVASAPQGVASAPPDEASDPPDEASDPPVEASDPPDVASDPSDVVSGPPDVAFENATQTVIDPAAHVNGTWSDAYYWPLCPIHMVLLRDGKVLSYGTDPTAIGGKGFYYDIWDPALGLNNNASHTTLPTTTDTNIFCSGHTLLPGSEKGEVLITGGDLGVEAGANLGIHHAQIFDPTTNELRFANYNMSLSRWYPSLTVLPNEQILVQGGMRENGLGALVPELFDPKTEQFKFLTGAENDMYYRYWYPKTYLTQHWKVMTIPYGGPEIWKMDPFGNNGTGNVELVKKLEGDEFGLWMPSVMYRRFRIMLFQGSQNAISVNIKDPNNPIVEPAGSLRESRYWSTTVLLPTQEVLIVGGARVNQDLSKAVLYGEIWTPWTNEWRVVATAHKARLYHSTALLLPDATVLVGGGGPPGPVVNQNAEIYEPYYLFRSVDNVTVRAPRPEIINRELQYVTYGEEVIVNYTSVEAITRLRLIRLGAVTHSFNNDERLETIRNFGILSDGMLNFTIPSWKIALPPGYYMLFLMARKVPSVAKILRVRDLSL